MIRIIDTTPDPSTDDTHSYELSIGQHGERHVTTFTAPGTADLQEVLRLAHEAVRRRNMEQQIERRR